MERKLGNKPSFYESLPKPWKNTEQRRSGNNKSNKTEIKIYLPTKIGGGGEPLWHQVDSPVSSVRPLESRKELEWLPACLYFLNLPKRIEVEKSENIHQEAQVPSHMRDATLFSWLHELAGGSRGLQDLACEQSTSGTAAGAQSQVGTRRSFKGALYRGHPKESLLPGLIQQSTQGPG